jgi:hypothetical protein
VEVRGRGCVDVPGGVDLLMWGSWEVGKLTNKHG